MSATFKKVVAQMTKVICITAGTSSVATGASTGEISGSALRGLEISRIHCARCHVVEPDRPFAGISSTPSFSLLVTAFEDWEVRYQSFHSRLPHPSIVRFADAEDDPGLDDANVPVVLEYQDIDAILAYARSLANPD